MGLEPLSLFGTAVGAEPGGHRAHDQLAHFRRGGESEGRVGSVDGVVGQRRLVRAQVLRRRK